MKYTIKFEYIRAYMYQNFLFIYLFLKNLKKKFFWKDSYRQICRMAPADRW